MTDPIADLLTRIRNAMQARHGNVVIPRSKIKLEIVKILKNEGFIEGYVEVERIPVLLRQMVGEVEANFGL